MSVHQTPINNNMKLRDDNENNLEDPGQTFLPASPHGAYRTLTLIILGPIYRPHGSFLMAMKMLACRARFVESKERV